MLYGRHVRVRKLNANHVRLLSKQSTYSLDRPQNQWLKHIRNIEAQISFAIINSETDNPGIILESMYDTECKETLDICVEF